MRRSVGALRSFLLFAGVFLFRLLFFPPKSALLCAAARPPPLAHPDDGQRCEFARRWRRAPGRQQKQVLEGALSKHSQRAKHDAANTRAPPAPRHGRRLRVWGDWLFARVTAALRLSGGSECAAAAMGPAAPTRRTPTLHRRTNPPTPVLPCLDPRKETPSLLG